ncbi:MAG: hypothetical protein U0105_22845 [Candidatus Obscuribacterales bacterium]
MSVDEMMKHAEIAAPCSAKWDEMTGDDKMRFCGECKLHVLNASAMTDEEVMRALQRTLTGERVCMRLYRRDDGTFLTQNCPKGLQLIRQRAQEAVRRVAALFSGTLALVMTCAASAAPGNSNNNKPIWHSIVQGAPAQAPKGPASTGAANVTPVVPRTYFAHERMGRMKMWTAEEIKQQETKLAQLKKSGASKAEIVKQLEFLAGICRYTTGTDGTMSATQARTEALKLYEEMGDWTKAAETSRSLSELYLAGPHENPAKAAEYRLKADQYFVRIASKKQDEDKRIATALIEVEKNKDWTKGNTLCADAADAAQTAKETERFNHWSDRADMYARYMRNPR